MFKKFLLLAVIFTFTFTLTAFGETIPDGITVNGKGVMYVDADIADINVGIQTENIVLDVAQKENSEKTEKLKNALIDYGIAEDKIITSYYGSRPIYDYEAKEEEPTLIGYRVVHSLTVETEDIDNIGEILDMAVEAGSNLSNSANFYLKDPTIHYNAALQLAVQNASKTAKALASYSGSTIAGVKSVYEHNSYDNYSASYENSVNDDAAAKVTGSGNTQISPEKIEVNARVTMSYKIQ